MHTLAHTHRRCLVSILSNFYTPEIVSDPKYKFSLTGTYYSPPKGDYESYLEFIRELPMSQLPEVFGMDDNVDISKELQETKLVGDGWTHPHTHKPTQTPTHPPPPPPPPHTHTHTRIHTHTHSCLTPFSSLRARKAVGAVVRKQKTHSTI